MKTTPAALAALARKKCQPCRGGTPPLTGAARRALLRGLGRQWRVVRNHHLEKEFAFPDFRRALAFTVKVGEIAEAHGHHPDILLAWGRVKIATWTHRIDGLTENDFVLAAHIERASRA